MKKLLLILIFINGLFSLNLEDVIHIVVSQSPDVKEKIALKQQGNYLKKATYGALMPSIDTGYVFSYNIPSSQRHYTLNSFNIKFNYNLFNGLKDYYAILQAKENTKRLDYNLTKSQAEIVLRAKQAYINILQFQTLLNILQERKKNIESQRNKAQQFVRQGIRAKNESLSMEILLSNTILSIKDTELKLSYQKQTLEKLLNTSFDTKDLEDIDINIHKEINISEIYQNILDQNPDYLNLTSMLDSAKFQNKSDFGNFLPTINLSGTKFWYIGGSNIVSTSYGLQSQIHLSATWNVFNGLRDNNKYQASRVYTLSLQNKIDALKRDLHLQLQDLVRQLMLTKEQFLISTDTLSKAEENYKIVNNRYAQGIATYTELIDAELLLNNARTNIAQAKYGFALLLAQIDYLENKIF
ncbi:MULTISPECIES: TolC family protein [unclassified Helicobacter]|uniref:TolC family protein n=1 Tax=unclassified Helicobacter TaxID=2593540 RepID=UPI000CF16FA3|nr:MULTISPECIES: TolC family protein [unclassified Helicobacter]